jgi:L-fucose mutarotase
VMTPPDGSDQPVFEEFRKRLPAGMVVEKIEQHTFYQQAREPEVALVIATGDTRNYANLMLTMGFVRHPEGKGHY